jgi:predicted RecB family nuclease
VDTRYDVSGVPVQGAYVAKQCPVRAQWDVIRPCDPLPPPAALTRRLARGRAFEADIVSRLLALHPDARVIAGDSRAAREHATRAAMEEGVSLIIGGRLPADPAGRRVGEPDLLVAAADGSGYRPADIKHHRCLDQAPGGWPARCSPLGAPAWEGAEPVPGSARARREDLLQLAHYQRMLEAAALAPAGSPAGGIVGLEGTVTWYDLGLRGWLTPGSGGRRKRRSTLEVYDFEFGFRLDVLAVAARHRADPSVPLLVVPVRIGECGQCPWWSWCGPQLAAGSGDVSLLPGTGWQAWRAHREHGITSRAALASLDHRTAVLAAERVDLRPVLAAIGTRPDDTPLAGILGDRKRAQLTRLRRAGVRTLGDARALDPRTAAYCDQPMRSLPEQIDQARAALGPAPAYRRRGVERVVVPRGAVEVDVDMENTEDGVYLWGALVTGRATWGGAPDGYRAFLTWAPLTAAAEVALFSEFWTWLSGLRAAAAAAGLAFRAYCYNATAESTQLRRLGEAAGVAAAVEAFTGGGDWVDLLRVFDRQLVTGGPAGLKRVAALAGYTWDVDDPGGAESMAYYDRAAGGDQAARDWLLAYNRGDTEATAALREWLDHAATGCPSVETLDPPARLG